MIDAQRFEGAALQILMDEGAARLGVKPRAPVVEISSEWQRGLITSESGAPKALLANAIHAFRCAPEWLGVVSRDAFAFRTVARKRTPWGFSGRWSEQQDALAAEWLQRRRIAVSADVTARAIETVAEENQFHPVCEFLEGLVWDGVPRVDAWLHVDLGAELNDYSRAVGARWLISAVARVKVPGCKADHVPILEGAQGCGKSSACRILGGEFFSDEISELGTKDSAMQASGAWIIELGELDALGRAEQSRIKAFISRSTDRFRPPYGRRVVELPRQCVFIGSVNHSTYLRDETGGRRYWPVQCGRIDLDALGRDRDQLWAEAYVRYSAGESWWLSGDLLTGRASQEQAERYESDPWQDLVGTWAAGRDSITMEQILMACLEKPKGNWTQVDCNRVARCLRVLGWERYQRRTADGGREWRYRKVQALCHQSEDIVTG